MCILLERSMNRAWHYDALRLRRFGKFQPMARHQLLLPVQMFRRYLPLFD